MTSGLLTDDGVRAALRGELLEIEPFADDSLRPASYDLRIGTQAFVTGDDEITDVARRGCVVIGAGEFAVLQTRERVHCGPQVVGLVDLAPACAERGLTLLAGKQIDPGFDGVLVVRVANLAPRRVILDYGSPLLSVQFFKLARPVAHPYSGSRQRRTGIRPRDMLELAETVGPTLGGVDLADLAKSVGALVIQMRVMMWLVPMLFAVVSVMVGLD